MKRQLIERAAVACAFVVGVGFGLVLLNGLEQAFFPVNKDWTVASIEVEGRDVIVSGRMRKARPCEYIAPVRARTTDGVHLSVTSTSPTSGQSWSPSVRPQQFGPWRVHGGAGSHVEIYQVHRCHPLWLTFSRLGEIKP